MKPVKVGDLVILPGLLDSPGAGWTRLHTHCCWWKVATAADVVGDEFDVVSPTAAAVAAAGGLAPPLLLPILDDIAGAPVRIVACGPYVCDFPQAAQSRRGTRWACPSCGTLYRLTGPKRAWFWRNWAAPHGHWVATFPTRRELRDRARALALELRR